MIVVKVICCALIITLATIGIIVVVLAIASIIDEYVKRKTYKRAKKHMLRTLSRYCDMYNVPIWAEENATRLIQNDYPLDKVIKMLERRAISGEDIHKIIGDNE